VGRIKPVRLCYIIISLYFLLSGNCPGQEREYSFNSPGSICYLQYLCYAADSNYSNIKRPFIFILGKENLSARKSFESDTLRLSSQFKDYYFVYLPGQGKTSVPPSLRTIILYICQVRVKLQYRNWDVLKRLPA